MLFFSALASEYVARRKRLRAALGDRGQSLFEMLLLGALVLGSLGLFIQPWMPAAAPWGFAVPFAFVGLYVWLDLRRQRALRLPGADEKIVRRGYDRLSLALALIAIAAGAAAFWIGLASRPPAPEIEWKPPPGAVEVDISP